MVGMPLPTPQPSALETWAHIATIIEAGAVVATAVFGFSTIGAWRKENLGKRKLEIAEQSLLAFYDYKQRQIEVRRRLDAPAELSAVEAFELNRSHYWNRLGWLGAIGDNNESLYSLRPQFQVYFGLEATETFDRLISTIENVRGSLREVFTSVPSKGNTLSPVPTLLDILGWSKASRPDDIDREVARAVADMEAICKPVLQGRR